MRAPWLLYVACAACRLGFDHGGGRDAAAIGDSAIADSAIGCVANHDEDGDGIDDACDVCPHLGDATQLDGDLDGVGDACDPHPAEARDRVVYFDPFVGPRSEWTFTGTPTFVGDGMVADATGAGRFVAGMAAEPGVPVSYSYRGSIGAVDASGERHLMLGMGGAPLFTAGATTFYYCELCGGGPCGVTTFFAYAQTLDGSIFTHAGMTSVTALQPGPIEHTFAQESPTVTCTTTWANAPMATAPVPALTPSRAGFAVIGVRITLDYFIAIRSDGPS